jgi:L-iditol 2-dehydrogenase
MKVSAMFGDGKAGLVDKPDPIIKEDFALVKVHVVPTCTEYKAFKGGHKGDHFGHEAVGEVVEIAQPGHVKVGDRVVVQPQFACGRCWLCVMGEHIHCQNSKNVYAITGSSTGTATYAQYVIKQDWLLSPIPDDVSYEHAGMALCGLGPTFGAMQQMCVNALDTIMITGLGPVGLGGVINGKFRGAKVIVVENQPYRVNLAKDLGADLVLDPTDKDIVKKIMDFTNGIGVDKSMDCSGAMQAHRLMIDVTRRKGQVTFIGEGGEFPLAASNDMIRKGLILRGNWHYNLAWYPELMKTIKATSSQIDKFITHSFPMSEVQKAWELQTTGNCGKVILYPWK